MECVDTSIEMMKWKYPVLCEGSYCARLLDTSSSADLQVFAEARYECFVVRKGWVKPDPMNPGRETDRYDPYCYHLGVFQGQQLVAYLRALPWRSDLGFMLQHDFQELIGGDDIAELTHEGNVEFSRLVVAPPAGSDRHATLAIAELLFKLVYSLGKRFEWTAHYIVLEEAWLRILNRRFQVPYVPFGVPHTYPDGTKTLAATIRCDTLESSMFATSVDKYHWYRDGVV